MMDTKVKCICQFCICGRHRCPQDRGSLARDPNIPLSPIPTEYQMAYEEHSYQPRRPNLRPKEQDPMSPRAPMNSNSTYTDAFLNHDCACPRTPFRPRYVPVRSNIPFDIDSIYRRDFTEKNGKRLDSYKPDSNYVRSSAKVDKDTMYRVTFKEHGQEDWAWCRASPIRHKECIENFGSGATNFESTSVMKNDFRHHERPDRAVLQRPHPENSVEGGTFQSDTSYKTDFKQKQIAPVQAIKPHEYRAPTSRFEGNTTVKSDYTPHPGHQREPPFRPPVNQQPVQVQFQGSTTTSEAYREWPAQQMEKPRWAKQKAYEPTPNSRAYSSCYQSDFVQPENFERVKPLKPITQDKDLLHGPRNSDIPKVTHYMEKFVPFKKTHPPKSFKMNQVYETPREKFTGESVYQANYTGERASPAQAIVQNQRRNSDEAPRSIDFHTTYKGTYKADRPASCPAKELMSASDEYGHIGFKNGHQYYVQRSPRRCKTPNNMDPLFPQKPESQKSDRERSSSRPSSARKSPRSPSKTDQRVSSRSSRPTTPRQPSTRPKSGHKSTQQTSPRSQETKTSPRATTNVNNSNGNAAKGAKSGDSTGKSVPRKAGAKPGNENNSNSNAAKSSPKHSIPKAVPKKESAKPDTNKKNTNSEVPPPIRPPKKTEQSSVATKDTPEPKVAPATTKATSKATPTPAAPSTPPVTTTTATKPDLSKATAATAKTTEAKAVPRPENKASPAPAKIAVSAPAPAKPAPSAPVSSTAPELPTTASPAKALNTPMPAAVTTSPAKPSAVPATVSAPVPATIPAPVQVTVPVTVPAPVPATVPPPVPATVPANVPTTVPATVPSTAVEPVSVKPSVKSPVPPAVTTASIPVTPPLIVPSKASLAAAAPPPAENKKPIPSSDPVSTKEASSTKSTVSAPPPTTTPQVAAVSTTPKPVSTESILEKTSAPISKTAPEVAPPAPVLPPAPAPAEPVQLLDLSALENKLLAGKMPTQKEAPEPIKPGDQMPVIAPPPAPAQPVVRTSGIQHETNLMQ